MIVFSTKARVAFLKDCDFRERTHAYLKRIYENQGSPSLAIGGVEDHVHILCRLSKTGDVSTLVRDVKRDSSKWIKANAPRLAEFHWQQGYGAFRSVHRTLRPSSNTLRIRWRIIGRRVFRMSFVDCARSMGR